jgi:hypothetical protein
MTISLDIMSPSSRAYSPYLHLTHDWRRGLLISRPSGAQILFQLALRIERLTLFTWLILNGLCVDVEVKFCNRMSLESVFQ